MEILRPRFWQALSRGQGTSLEGTSEQVKNLVLTGVQGSLYLKKAGSNSASLGQLTPASQSQRYKLFSQICCFKVK